VDKEFRDPAHSPFKEKATTDYHGLSYFDIDPAYKVKARFERTPDEKTFMMATSNPDRSKEYVKYGTLYFKLNGKELQLSVLQSIRLSKMKEYRKHLFLPFTDLTTGKECYGGGRYLDLEIPKGNTMIVDFNLCYNPYCAYGDGWSCPIPPQENFLDTRVEAGVKKYDDH